MSEFKTAWEAGRIESHCPMAIRATLNLEKMGVKFPIITIVIYIIITTTCVLCLSLNIAPRAILALATYPVSLLTADKCVTTSLTRLLAPLISCLMLLKRDYFFPWSIPPLTEMDGDCTLRTRLEGFKR